MTNNATKPDGIRLDGIKAVLFDLDGTLVDTAPDLGYALNLQRARHGLAPLPDDLIRPAGLTRRAWPAGSRF